MNEKIEILLCVVLLGVGIILPISLMVANTVTHTGSITGVVIQVDEQHGFLLECLDIEFQYIGSQRFAFYDYDFEIGKTYTIYYNGGLPFRTITKIVEE